MHILLVFRTFDPNLINFRDDNEKALIYRQVDILVNETSSDTMSEGKSGSINNMIHQVSDGGSRGLECHSSLINEMGRVPSLPIPTVPINEGPGTYAIPPSYQNITLYFSA